MDYQKLDIPYELFFRMIFNHHEHAEQAIFEIEEELREKQEKKENNLDLLQEKR